jgi:hypothetical protein
MRFLIVSTALTFCFCSPAFAAGDWALLVVRAEHDTAVIGFTKQGCIDAAVRLTEARKKLDIFLHPVCLQVR